jgi:hypothetical protein
MTGIPTDGGANYPIQFRPYFRLVGCLSRVVLDWVDLAMDYQIVLYLILPEVEVRTIMGEYNYTVVYPNVV